MSELTMTTSRRALLSMAGAAPVAALSTVAPTPWAASLGSLYSEWDDQPIALSRTKRGRGLSRFRYHNAESFFVGIEQGVFQDRCDLLYQTGIVMQLGISSHLFDVGFDDRWCARNIGLRVSKSLAYANATGFGYDHPETNLLAAILTPYGKWRNRPSADSGVGDSPFTAGELCRLTRALLERVREVTGHPRPRGWSARNG